MRRSTHKNQVEIRFTGVQIIGNFDAQIDRYDE